MHLQANEVGWVEHALQKGAQNWPGTISELSVQQNIATAAQAYYCKEALAGPAPFEKWTKAMRREIGADVRSCRFSFHYLIR